MDFFVVLREHKALLCKKCGFIVNPHNLAPHLRTTHAIEVKAAGRSATALAKECYDTLGLATLPTFDTQIPRPAPTSAPIPGLRLYCGYGCHLCEIVRREAKGMANHYKEKHPYTRKRCGPAPWSSVHFQQFAFTGLNRYLFRVEVPTHETQELFLRTQDVRRHQVRTVLQQQLLDTLEERESTLAMQRVSVSATATRTEVSPWLEVTRWHQYLRDHSLPDVVGLTAMPDLRSEPVLGVVCDSLERLVDAAYRAVCEDKINPFDQLRINTFQSTGRLFSRPLLVKLQKSTYRTYINLWKRLLCFAYRSTRPDQPLVLSHALNSQQQQYLQDLISQATCHATASHPSPHSALLLDTACLNFTISILDHKLRGNLFESVALGFLAVLGVDLKNETLHEAYSYTPSLSRFIKIAQLLMVQRAVTEAEQGRAEYASDLLEEMCSRFMLDNTSSPLAWAIRLRSFGKKIKTSTTTQGFITWSEDQETLSYKDLEFSMQQFRGFVSNVLRQAQASLRQILLLHEEEEVIQVVPRLPLSEVKDNPGNTTRGWCFLHDVRNEHIFQPGDKWLMRRVSSLDWLQQEFIQYSGGQEIEWNCNSIRGYGKEADLFLELLLLLVHLTAGQPARGTELMSLRYLNAAFHRNVFIEHGLVATVTSYHKGYSVQGSTKIIHRYLPRPVSELLIYYLWLVVPFQRQLHLLIDASAVAACQPWLWSSPLLEAPWTSPRLSTILQRESGNHFPRPINLQIYRQVAIAISRTHLASGGFKVDYGIEQKAIDAQAAHESNLAGSIYARGLQQAHGQMEARQAIFRAVSREWHEFLGFTRPLESRKRGFGQREVPVAVVPLAKRRKVAWEDCCPISSYANEGQENSWSVTSARQSHGNARSTGPVFGVLKPTLKWVY